VLSPLNEAFELTETSRQWLIYKPLEMAGYIALALVLRFIGHRLIDRLTSGRLRRRSAVLHERAAESARSSVSERRAQRAKTIGSVFKSVVSIVLLVWVVLNVLQIVGVNVAPFIASAGIVGLALGFGAQNLVKDFLAGIFMLLEDQYGVGDIVDFGQANGTVEAVGLRVTTLRDANGTVWYLRNGEVVRVGNKSQGFAIAVVDLPLARPANVIKATAVAERTAKEAVSSGKLAEDVLDAPQMLGVDSVSAETVTLRLTVKVRPGRQWSVQRALNQRILDALSELDEVETVEPVAAAALQAGTMEQK
jgi:small-conductance mechanosensitive channel